MNALILRLKLAWAAFRMKKEFYVVVSKPEVVSFMARDSYCDYPESMVSYSKKEYSKACGRPADVCTGHRGYKLSIEDDTEDNEICVDHQKELYGFVPKSDARLREMFRTRRGREMPQ